MGVKGFFLQHRQLKIAGSGSQMTIKMIWTELVFTCPLLLWEKP
jgi:hypothetical protein